MLKALIFDLNGVFIASPKLSDRFPAAFGVEASAFMEALRAVLPRIQLPGAGDAFAYWQPYLRQWGVGISGEDFFNFWFSVEQPVPEMIEIARQTRQAGIKVFALSNNFAERTRYYDAQFPILKEVFDHVYYSWQTGFIKPDSRAYELIMTEHQLQPSECLYFDDSPANVSAAEELGIRSFLFEGPASVERVLAADS
ncbi:HAD family phosphatase [Candidatus Parcubacteria bacterium]|nr:HAD family phosphatase [Candidatus Parcubacteria bacterium]MBI4099049.1 HAD family phosphatase [Candidatus Parcubacteria bacterium]MBI4385391.1 HAD family phosphatase [Candidatus Parcubacteria bacterium]